MLWDVFCKVIDNHGDIGVCWRLCAELARRGESMRLWADDLSALQWMAPGGHERVQCIHWAASPPDLEPGDVVVEAFGCDPPANFVARMGDRLRQSGRQPPWINLEYLSAEDYVERSHGLPSPVSSGPGAGLVKRFIYPGFTANTGGLLRETDLAARQARFDRDAWLGGQGVRADGRTIVSLFCYEPAALGDLIEQLATAPHRTVMLVTAGRAQSEVRRLVGAVQRQGNLQLHDLPLLSQADFDHLLWSSDFNLVRGEDSLVRAIWAGKPFAWHLYPQDDGAHGRKLEAFLDWLTPHAELRTFHRVWNGLAAGPLPQPRPGEWARAAELARDRALSLPELASSLQQHVQRTATM